MSLENQFNQLFKQHTWKLKQCTNGHRPTFLICCTAVAFPPLLEVGSFLSKPRNSPDVPNRSWFANTFSGGIPRIDATGFRTSYSVNNLQYKRRILIYNVFCTFNWQMRSERKKKGSNRTKALIELFSSILWSFDGSLQRPGKHQCY